MIKAGGLIIIPPDDLGEFGSEIASFHRLIQRAGAWIEHATRLGRVHASLPPPCGAWIETGVI
ncbi:hypothetical protein N825_08955 [Skermanella stibiiresistens SB22]|uniref:Uncharacterized protein n=1 Tax=Skermanella stibiiresistens SB22 TaxID=1385369 RepID=W9H5V5_9PROT|nr:hypothetical protein N825_08955 [Skermanella stibiiresistens SB22]